MAKVGPGACNQPTIRLQNMGGGPHINVTVNSSGPNLPQKQPAQLASICFSLSVCLFNSKFCLFNSDCRARVGS